MPIFILFQSPSRIHKNYRFPVIFLGENQNDPPARQRKRISTPCCSLIWLQIEKQSKGLKFHTQSQVFSNPLLVCSLALWGPDVSFKPAAQPLCFEEEEEEEEIVVEIILSRTPVKSTSRELPLKGLLLLLHLSPSLLFWLF